MSLESYEAYAVLQTILISNLHFGLCYILLLQVCQAPDVG